MMNTPINIQSIKTGRSTLENWLRVHYEEFYEYLTRNYTWTDNYKEKLYCYYNGITRQPFCKCGNPLKFHGYIYGYSEFCGPLCAQRDEKTRSKQKNTVTAKYGTDYRKLLSEKSRKTKLDRYGDEKYNNQEKMRKTMLERYGVDNIMKSKKYREKAKKTMLDKYGYECNFTKPGTKDRYKISKMKHYPDVIDILDNGDFICTCPDLQCDKCTEKTYIASYYTYYQRRFVYNIHQCTKKHPLYNIQRYKNTSIEKFIKTILDNNNIDYISNDRNTLNKMELDIYIPSYNLAIECNGIYYHNDKVKPKDYHYNKFIKCQELGIQLLNIWEDQIINTPHIIESIILSKLGIYKKRIYARKCTIKEISAKDCSGFLEENHLQGQVKSNIRIGLYYNNELISVMSFGKKRKALGNKNIDGWEMYRYCNKLGTQVIGGASKLLNYFIKHYNPKNIESFASNDISNGLLYNKLGFKLISQSYGSYWYIKNKVRYHRYKFIKSNLVKQGYDPDKTEFQIMDELGYHRIFDSGQTKYILNIKY